MGVRYFLMCIKKKFQMMAGRSGSGKTCQILLQRLQRGQNDLQRSLVQLKPSKRQRSCSSRSRASLVSRQRGGSSPLCCVRHLPVRRARTEQLSSTSPPSHAHVARTHRRRLSSTPKHSSPPPPLLHSHFTHHSPHNTDISLENALLPHTVTGGEKEGGRNERTNDKTILERLLKKSKKSVRGRESRESKTGVERKVETTPASSRRSLRKSMKSNRLEHKSGETSVQSSPELHTSLSRVVDNSASVRSRYDTRRKKPRGLAVSFVTDEKSKLSEDPSDCGLHRDGLHKRKCGDLRYTEEEEKEESLEHSLNLSRFGALEHQRKSGTLCKKTPRLGQQRWAGDDPRLGYDWIAGLVETGSVLENKDEEYFVEMKEFRRVNHSECSRPHPIFLPDTDESSTDSLSPPHPSLSTTSTHTHCTQSYVINNRLFPVPQSTAAGEGGKRCPVCEGKRERGGGGKQLVRYIRVSVPRSSVQAPYQLRPHRRRSFDPSDSMALNKHCLAGWNSAKPPCLPPQPSLDLKSALAHSPNTEPLPHSNTAQQTHITPASAGSRPTKPSSRSLSRDLLNTSHSAEYSLRSRGHRKL